MSQIAYAISMLLRFYTLLIVIWALLSWIPRERGGLLDDISQTLGSLIEPVLMPIRQMMPTMAGMDFSPVVAILLIDLIRMLLMRI